MIDFKRINKYCCEDPRLIENYEKAVNDPETWDCHHRLETDLGLSMNELIEQGKYYNVPANELIFLTKTEHYRLHNNVRFKDPKNRQKQSEKFKGENNPMWGKNLSEERKHEISISLKDRPWMNNGVTECRPKTQEEIDHYISLGYHRGRK